MPSTMHLTAVFYMEASFEVVPETSRLDDNNSAVQLAACCALLGVVNSGLLFKAGHVLSAAQLF